MTKDEIRMKLWCDVYARLIAIENTSFEDANALADEAIIDFDKRFPAESSEPVDHTWTNISTVNESKEMCIRCGKTRLIKCRDGSEPVDEPRKVWVTFNDDDFAVDVWPNKRSAFSGTEFGTSGAVAYAEFQQVGPMVRSDDE